MEPQRELRFQRSMPDEGTEFLTPTVETLERTLRAMRHERSAGLSIHDRTEHPDEGIDEGSPALLISASEGHYAVTFIVEEDGGLNAYDLIGDHAQSEKWITLIVGGQETPWPSEYIVQEQQVIEVAVSYFVSGHIDILNHRWINSNSVDSAWDRNH